MPGLPPDGTEIDADADAETDTHPGAGNAPGDGAGETGSDGLWRRVTGRDDARPSGARRRPDGARPGGGDGAHDGGDGEESAASRWLRLAREKATAAADHGDEPARLTDRLRRVVSRDGDGPGGERVPPPARPQGSPEGGVPVEEWRPRRLAEAAARRRAQEAAEAAGRSANIPGTDTPAAPRLVPGANWPAPDAVDEDAPRRPDAAPADGDGADKKLGSRVAKFLNRKDAE